MDRRAEAEAKFLADEEKLRAENEAQAKEAEARLAAMSADPNIDRRTLAAALIAEENAAAAASVAVEPAVEEEVEPDGMDD